MRPGPPAEPADFARGFRLAAVPDDFFDDPYRYYAILRTHDPGPSSCTGSWVRRSA